MYIIDYLEAKNNGKNYEAENIIRSNQYDKSFREEFCRVVPPDDAHWEILAPNLDLDELDRLLDKGAVSQNLFRSVMSAKVLPECIMFKVLVKCPTLAVEMISRYPMEIYYNLILVFAEPYWPAFASRFNRKVLIKASLDPRISRQQATNLVTGFASITDLDVVDILQLRTANVLLGTNVEFPKLTVK